MTAPSTSATPQPDAARTIVVGTVGRPFGVAGWMHVKSHTEPAENILGYRPWQASRGASGHWQQVDAEARSQQGGLVARFDGAADRDAAAAWRGARIGVCASALPTAAEREHYWHDLIGLRVVTRDGDDLGAVARLFSTGAHDVLVVQDAGRERLLPFVGHVVETVDAPGGRIVVDWRRDWL